MDGDYPKTKFHVRGGGSITVTTAAQEKALGEEWIDSKRLEATDAGIQGLGRETAGPVATDTSTNDRSGAEKANV